MTADRPVLAVLVAALAGGVAGGAVAALLAPTVEPGATSTASGDADVAAELRALRDVYAAQASAPAAGPASSAGDERLERAHQATVQALEPSASGDLAAAMRQLAASLDRLADLPGPGTGILPARIAEPAQRKAALRDYLKATPRNRESTNVDLFGLSPAEVIERLGRPDSASVYDTMVAWRYADPDGTPGFLTVGWANDYVVWVRNELR